MPTRRDCLRTLAVGAAGLAWPRVGRGQEAERPPNFVLVMADDLGYGDLGCYGSQLVKTPHLDALARRGLRFTDYHSNGAVCSPTRAALLTGRYQQRAGIEGVITAAGHRDQGLDLSETTFAELLRGAGYATGMFGKWHLGYAPEFNPTRQGFDEFVGFVSGNIDSVAHLDSQGIADWWRGDQLVAEDGYATHLVTQHGLDFISRHRERPFCLYLPHGAPHSPYQGAGDPAVRTAGQPGTAKAARKVEEVYAEMIAAVDDGVGQLVAKLDDLGLSNDTLVVFCSDNGPTGPGSAGVLRGRKGTLFEGGHRVPGLACWPGRIAPGRDTAATVLGMDWFSTMAALAGAAVPERPLDGIDVTAALEGRALPARPLFWQAGGKLAMRDGDWKWHRAGPQQAPELCHLGEDLAEARNLAEREPARAKAMQAAAEQWYATVTAGVIKRV